MRSIILWMIGIITITTGCEKKGNEIPRVPTWASEAVWYQIFPERFMNGDKSNDPLPKDMEDGWPYKIPEGWQVHPWTSDWYKLQPWEAETGNDFYWNSGVRRYGGDLQGVLDKLDYLQDLGITAIYFNPVFEAPSLHKYDATFYHHIDNNFGPDPEKDREIWESEDHGDPSTWQWTTADKLFLKLIEEAHKRNIKIIIDGVFNHVGNTFWAFEDVVKNQQDSKYKEWFTIKSWDDPNTDENEFDYEGWFGVRDLPEITEDSTGLVKSAADHIHDIVKRWMDPNGDGDPSDGIDGWRLDVADMVNINFWKKFRTWVKEINPEAYITGEIWWHNWDKNEMTNAAPWLQGDTFDAVMNYRFTKSVKHFVMDQETQMTATSFIDSLDAIAFDYPKENLYAMMNLMGSHDVERLASIIVNPDQWYDHWGKPSETPDWDVRKPNETERLIQKLAVGVQMTMPGAPMIYYGDETGMWGGDDPDCRKPMVWPEFEYETETTHPFGKERPHDTVEFNKELFEWYKKLISIRQLNSELSDGEIEYFFADDEKKLLGFKRTLNNNYSIILLNNKNEKAEISIDLKGLSLKEELTNLLNNQKLVAENSKLNFSLEPYQIVILK